MGACLTPETMYSTSSPPFAERGFHRATIHEVARATGVADGTIYTYFEHKTALLQGILDRLNGYCHVNRGSV